MDVDLAKEVTINWISQAPWKLKHDFIKSILVQVPESEVKTIQNLTQKTRNEIKRNRAAWSVTKGRDESAPEESAPPDLSKGRVSDEKFQLFWKNNKQSKSILLEKQNQLKLKVAGRGKLILNALRKQSTITSEGSQQEVANMVREMETEPPQTVNLVEEVEPIQNDEPSDENATAENTVEIRSYVRDKPSQQQTKLKITELQKRIVTMEEAKNLGVLNSSQLFQLKEMRKNLIKQNLKLKRLKSGQRASRKLRRKQRHALEKAKLQAPKEFEDITLQDCPGRPRLERQQPDLLDTIIKITTAHCSADERRRSDNLRCMRTLDDLLLELQDMGFNISRTALYVRLLPKRFDSLEGKRHVTTVPVKLARTQNNLRKPHADSHFAAATVRYLRDLAGLFGNDSVFVLSQDDKARVPLGLPAATRQGPILMTMEYRVQLPDHDWMVATRHKLIPSVYAALEIKDGRVTASGPTFIAIRSGKHDASTAYSHALDLEKILKSNSFKPFTKTESEQVKPVWILLVDGGPDENPRFPKVLNFAAQHFMSNDLDAIFIATHAPHQSASNPVERRMAPLSRDLCGVILPYDTFGTHLDGNGRTVDSDLEIKNFQKAGETLAEIWSQRIIDNFEVEASYVPPRGNGAGSTTGSDSISYVREGDLDWLTEEWKTIHVRQSQYLLQIMKCGNRQCCRITRTNLRKFLGDGFLPAPVRFSRKESGLVQESAECNKGNFLDLSTRLCMKFCLPNLPFDFYCPSVLGKLQERTCNICCIGFATKKAFLNHKRSHRNITITEEVVDDEDETTTLNEGHVSNEMYQIRNLSAWMKSPFVDDSS